MFVINKLTNSNSLNSNSMKHRHDMIDIRNKLNKKAIILKKNSLINKININKYMSHFANNMKIFNMPPRGILTMHLEKPNIFVMIKQKSDNLVEQNCMEIIFIV